jgi:ligand-binding sensor domain-containing protein
MAQTGWTVYNNTNTILSSGYYGAIAIDQSGNIWVGGSYTGLYKFDGTTWTKFSTSNSTLLDNSIKEIVIDNSNKVWAANYKGVSVYNGSTFTNYDTTNASFDGPSVYALGKDINGKIWLASQSSLVNNGITTFDGSTWVNLTGYPSQINSGEFTDFAFTPSNDAWIASQSGITKYTGSFTFYPYAVTGLWSSSCVAVDASSNVWAGGFDGLLKYDGSSWTMYDNVADLNLGSNTLYNCIFPDGNYLWIGSSAGLLQVNRNTGAVLAKYNSLNSPLTNNSVSRIAKDANGYLWMATSIGIVKMNPALVGVEENYTNNKLSIYPNPSEGKYHISMDDQTDLSYEIYAMDGKLVKEGKLTSINSELNIADAPNGMYFIHLITPNANRKIVKLIKQ